jgi:hypothetical protein
MGCESEDNEPKNHCVCALKQLHKSCVASDLEELVFSHLDELEKFHSCRGCRP